MNEHLESLVKMMNALPGVVVIKWTDGINKSQEFEAVDIAQDEYFVQFFVDANTNGMLSLGVLTRTAEQSAADNDDGIAMIETWTGEDVFDLFYELRMAGGVGPEKYSNLLDSNIKHVLDTYVNEEIDVASMIEENADDIVWN